MSKTTKGAAAVLEGPPPDPAGASDRAWRDWVERVCFEWAAGKEPSGEVRDAIYAKLGQVEAKRQRELAHSRLLHMQRCGTTAQRAQLAQRLAEAQRAVREDIPKLEQQIELLKDQIKTINAVANRAAQDKDRSDQSRKRLEGFRNESGCVSLEDEQAYHGRLAGVRASCAWTEGIQKKERLDAIDRVLQLTVEDHRTQIADYLHHHCGCPDDANAVRMRHGLSQAQLDRWAEEVRKLSAERDAIAGRSAELEAWRAAELAEAAKIRTKWVDRIDEWLGAIAPPSP